MDAIYLEVCVYLYGLYLFPFIKQENLLIYL